MGAVSADAPVLVQTPRQGVHEGAWGHRLVEGGVKDSYLLAARRIL